jgi:hypothetical protein
MMLSVSIIHKVDETMINKCGAVGGTCNEVFAVRQQLQLYRL